MSAARVASISGAVAVMAVVTVVAAAVVVPVLVLVAAVLGLPETLSASTLSTLTEAHNLHALLTTAWIAAGAVAVAAVVAVPAAIAVERTDVFGGTALGALVALPLAVPSYLLAFAFRAAFDDRIGVFSGVTSLVGDVDSAAGIAVVLGVSLAPIVLLRLRASLASIDGALEEAARTHGASPLRALVDVTLPLCVPSVVSSLSLVFAGSAAAFGVPMLLGAGASPAVVVVTTRITVALQSGSSHALPEALALSVALAGLSGLAFAVPALLPRGVAVVTGKASRPTRLSLGPWRAPVSAVLWALVIVVVVTPLLALLLQGLTLFAGAGLSPSNLGFKHVAAVLARDDVQTAARNSLLLASVAAAAITLVAVVVVVARRRSSGVVQRALMLVGRAFELSYALPGTVVAVAMVLTFAAEVRFILLDRLTLVLALGGTSALLLVAYVVKEAALGFRAVDEALDQLHPSLEEAARLSGASPTRAFVDVTLPLLRPHLVAAAIAIALPCFTELTMSVLLQAPGTSTLGVVLFSLYEYGDPQQAMALAAVLVVVALALQILVLRLRRR